MLSRQGTASLALAASTFFAAQVAAHSYMVLPKGRLAFANNFGDSAADGTGDWSGLCHIGDGTPTCCNTRQMSDSQQTTYKRGDEVPARWWRNNHAGGFVRWSIVPIGDSSSQDAFDAAENVVSYACNQVGCDETYGGDSPNNWNGGDSHGNMGWSNQCTGSFKVPYHLKDGTYTLQWVWFGTGNAPSANSPFQTCVDFKIKGGPTGTAPKCPLWKGGDLSEKSANACSYVSVNNPTYQGTCAEANKCTGSYEVGVPKAVQDCYSGRASNSFPLVMVSAPQGFPDTFSNYSPSSSGGSSSSSKSKSKSSSSPKSKSSGKTKTNTSTGNVKAATKSRKCSSLRRRTHSRRAAPRFHGRVDRLS